MKDSSRFVHYVRKNFDALAITTTLAHLAWSTSDLSELDHTVLAALRRSHSPLEQASLDEIQAYLQQFNEDQIVGLISNVKGILHEMEFVRLENEDGDSIYASYFDHTNHANFDVILSDQDTGESWQIQLKATDSTHYVKDWIATHSADDIVVTEEIAQKLGLESSGFSNKELTQSVEDAIDFIITAKDPNDEHFWDYFPVISLASISLAIYELFKRYQKQEINWSEFKWMAAKISGLKISKIAFIGLLLGLPLVGQITGAYLIAQLLLNAKSTWFDSKNPLYHKIQTHFSVHKKPTQD